jgi:hypothetical protein
LLAFLLCEEAVRKKKKKKKSQEAGFSLMWNLPASKLREITVVHKTLCLWYSGMAAFRNSSSLELTCILHVGLAFMPAGPYLASLSKSNSLA